MVNFTSTNQSERVGYEYLITIVIFIKFAAAAIFLVYFGYDMILCFVFN